MTLSPGIIALVVCSSAVCLMLLIAVRHAIAILRYWDLSSGSELQLALERRTYLISTLLSVFLPLQLFSLFLFIHTVDGISHLFTGAMCAAGTLKVNNFGYPTLLLKILTSLIAGVWLILNQADNQAADYPLIRIKYSLLLVLAPFAAAEAVSQGVYFWRLRPDIITSCCGSLFSRASGTVASDIIAAPVVPMEVVFFAVMAATIASGTSFLATKRGACLVAVTSAGALITTITAVISFVSLYVYELPSHHCPFCLLQPEYHFIGYLLYGLLLTGTITGIGVGVLNRFRAIASLKEPLNQMQQKLALIATISFAGVVLIVAFRMIFSAFRLST